MSETKEIVIDCTTGEPEEFKLNARGENGVYTTMVRGIPVGLSYTVTDYGPENRTEMDITFSIVCEKPPETTAHMVGAKEAVQWFDNWGLTPETANKALQNYSALIFDITGGRLSKIGYDVAYIKRIADDYQTEICDECKKDWMPLPEPPKE